jgi:2-amino-4-hydroxy-6-hydroxymethyldihydropteridine diphosphokinase
VFIKLSGDPNFGEIRASKVYETDPIGGPRQGKFLNAVLGLKTIFSLEKLFSKLLSIESEQGRVRTHIKNGPRTLDIDLLFYGEQVLTNENLILPHPRLAERAFVLKPFLDIAPKLRHPVYQKTILELYNNLMNGRGSDQGVKFYSDYPTQG